MSDGKTQPVKVQPRFGRAADIMLRKMFGVEKTPNENRHASINLGHKIGDIMSHAKQRRLAKKRRNIRARLPMNKK